MSSSEDRKVNALGEPMWVDVLKSLRTLVVFIAIVIAVGGGLAIAIIAPWGRANPECSIYCVIVNKLRDPVDWEAQLNAEFTADMLAEVEREMTRYGIAFDMPNYRQHQVWLNNEQYEGMISAVNMPMDEIKHPKTGKSINIGQELYLKIKSEDYQNIKGDHAKFEKRYVFNAVFENRKDIALAKLYGIQRPEYEAKAEQGDADAQYKLGLQYLSGKGVAKDPVEAENWLTRAAGQGNANAQYALARMYHEGQGVPRNYEAAVKWYTKAADYGHKHAQHHLGMMYHKGLGVEKNEQTAKKWWGRATLQGYRVDEEPEAAKAK